MDELKQIKAVLLGLGIQVAQINISKTGLSISVVLLFHGQTITREYTIEQLRSGLVTGPGSGPAARQDDDHKPNGLVSRILCRRRRE